MPNTVKFPLCPLCHSRFSGKEKSRRLSEATLEKECFICEGALSCIQALAASAISDSKHFEWETFSVSSSFPKKIFIREQKVADYFLPGDFSSLKNSANYLFSQAVSKATGKKNSQRNADAVFSFDFISGKSSAKPSQAYVFGHYIKLARGFCQSRWHCSDCGGKGCDSCKGSGMNYPSVEDELGKMFMPAFSAQGCTLHASGREDVDVRALGNGRPFVLEIASPRKRNVDLKKLEKESATNPNVRAIELRLVGKQFIDAVCGSHFDKEYSAIVSADRPLLQNDAQLLSSLSGTTISQQTPTRVMSRRADLLRKRRLNSVSAECIADGKLLVKIFAEAGTYIKELIHSDGGRTVPSFSQLLGCKAACDELDVAGIHDFFLETVEG